MYSTCLDSCTSTRSKRADSIWLASARLPERGHDMKPHDTPEGFERLRVAVDLDMHAHVGLAELGHRRLRNGLGQHRILAALDAVDHDNRLAPRGVGPHVAVAVNGGALRAGRPARLTDCSDWCRARPLSGEISRLLPSVLSAGGTLTSAITAPRNVHQRQTRIPEIGYPLSSRDCEIYLCFQCDTSGSK